jgi:TPR repeat protein
MHSEGLGVEKNADEAWKWLSLAAKPGDQQAGKQLARLDDAEEFARLVRAVAGGDALAQGELGWYYRERLHR